LTRRVIFNIIYSKTGQYQAVECCCNYQSWSAQSVSVTEVIFAPMLWVCTAASNLSITLVTIQKHTKFGNSPQQDRTYIIQ